MNVFTAAPTVPTTPAGPAIVAATTKKLIIETVATTKKSLYIDEGIVILY